MSRGKPRRKNHTHHELERARGGSGVNKRAGASGDGVHGSEVRKGTDQNVWERGGYGRIFDGTRITRSSAR